jgi:hypothetical protein
MKKILTTFLISLTLLTNNNTAFAGFFEDACNAAVGFGKSVSGINQKKIYNTWTRCKVGYTQLDLNTGLEVVVENIVEFDMEFAPEEVVYCYSATQDFAEKINEWLSESDTNVVANITVTNCQIRSTWKKEDWKAWNFYDRDSGKRYEDIWGEYRGCEDEISKNLVEWIEYHKQQGFNVHKERLIKEYDEIFEQASDKYDYRS